MAAPMQSTLNWIDAWADVQRKSWESWSALSQQALSGSPSGAPEVWRYWQEGVEPWRELFWPKIDPAAQDVYRKLVEQGMTYLRLTEEVFKGMQGAQSAIKLGEDWMEVLNRLFDQAKEACSRGSPGGNNLFQGCLALWGLPLDTWRRIASSLSPFPGDMLHGLKEADVHQVGDAVHANLQRFLSIPALGYTREWQEQGQEAARYWLQYQQALGKYMSVVGKVGIHALDLLQRKLVDMAATGKRVESLRQLYDLWVDCGEESYAEITSAAEYGEVSAGVVNASMALKRQGQLMVQEALSALNAPSRRELDTAHFRVHKLNREVKALQQQLKDARTEPATGVAGEPPKPAPDPELQTLREDLQALRHALEDLTVGGTGAESASEVRETTAPSKVAAAQRSRPKSRPRGG
jgi:poly[(R)-3-hydroxyalkanoate] polymerase subunit PhaE